MLQNSLNQLINELRLRKLTVATAESCSGGLMASFLTEQPGSSAWFERGFVTYSNASKQEILGVEVSLIEQHGVVSEAVAKAMAVGALNQSAAQVSIAITGIAGPSGGSLKNPVGTVCFGFATSKNNVTSTHHYFTNTIRQEIRLLACQEAFRGMLACLKLM